jgi:Asp-tRNA(Asn)/Glu-tRNA(Gln) amidotransferase A subunit family amidase
MSPEEYARHDATALVALICTGEVTKAEVLDAALGRIADKNREINAVVDLYDQPVEDTNAQGPFAGVPFLLKDIGAGISGKRTSCASRAFLSVRPQNHDDELTMRFKQSGLRILGKTNLPELGFNVTSEPVLFGPTRNPFDLTRSAGGSSGGAAAAVASGMVPIAHATDGAGSIRIPAACCGMVGLKPSRGLVPQGPAHADIYGGLVSEGVIARSVRDMKTALAIMSGRDPGAPYAGPVPRPVRARCRIGILDAGADDFQFDDDARDALSHAVKRLRDAGHVVEPAGAFLSPDDWRVPREVYLAQVCANAAADFPGRDIPEELEPMNRAAIEMGRRMPVESYLGAIRRGHDFARRFADIWNRFDVLLTPALASAAPKLGLFPMDHEDVALHVDRMTRLAPFAGTFNLTGSPALVVGVSQTDTGLPLAVQLAGDIGDDPQLLALGEELVRV